MWPPPPYYPVGPWSGANLWAPYMPIAAPTWQQYQRYHPYPQPQASRPPKYPRHRPATGGAVLQGGLEPNTTYLFPDKHCTITVLTGDFDMQGRGHFPTANRVKVCSAMTVNEFINAAGGGAGWTMTEVYGDGPYRKGLEIKEGTDAAKKTLEDQGFTREDVKVWLHKV